MIKIGSEEWIEWRKQHICASDCPIILEISPYRKPIQLWAEKLDLIEPQPTNPFMKRGQELEESAREEFERLTGLLVFPTALEHPTLPYLAASLDGMTLEKDAIVEIKCNGTKTHAMVLIGIIPDHHNAQIQHQLACTGLKFAYYFSFDGSKGIILEVQRDQEFINKMIEKENHFWNCIQSFTPPIQRNSKSKVKK